MQDKKRIIILLRKN